MKSSDSYFNQQTPKYYDKRKLVTVFVVFLVCLGLIAFLLIKNYRSALLTNNYKQNAEAATINTENKSVEGRYLFSGTIVLARAVEKAASGNYDQPFSRLSTFKPEQYDGWMADLECPVTNNNVSYQEQINNLVFNCRPEWLANYSKYFNLVNLANNHTNNMGQDGFLETQKNMDKAGIQSIGNFDPSVSEDACEVMSLPVKVVKKDGSKQKGELPVAFCAWHYFFRLPRPGEIEIAKRYSNIMPVFGFMHIGVEYLPVAGADQVNAAHEIIDSGTEFVVANSPHWVQNSEVYKGKPIFYSTGNFIFDQLDFETQRGLSVDVTMSLDYDDNVSRWLELGKSCRVRRDNCLETAEKSGLTKPKVKLIYEPIASSGGNRKVTQKGDNVLQKGVEERLNWDITKKELDQN